MGFDHLSAMSQVGPGRLRGGPGAQPQRGGADLRGGQRAALGRPNRRADLAEVNSC